MQRRYWSLISPFWNHLTNELWIQWWGRFCLFVCCFGIEKNAHVLISKKVSHDPHCWLLIIELNQSSAWNIYMQVLSTLFLFILFAFSITHANVNILKNLENCNSCSESYTILYFKSYMDSLLYSYSDKILNCSVALLVANQLTHNHWDIFESTLLMKCFISNWPKFHPSLSSYTHTLICNVH